MLLEYAQIISTVARNNNIDFGYKPTHVNHPSTKWAGTCQENFIYLVDLALALGIEYSRRYDNKIHACTAIIQAAEEQEIYSRLPSFGDRTPVPQCMPDQYKHSNSIVAYRRYYRGDKVRFARWYKGDENKVPFWMRMSDEEFNLLYGELQ